MTGTTDIGSYNEHSQYGSYSNMPPQDITRANKIKLLLEDMKEEIQ